MAQNLLFGTTRILMLLGCVVAAGCGEKKPADKTKEAPRVTAAHPITRTLTDEADYKGQRPRSAHGRESRGRTRIMLR